RNERIIDVGDRKIGATGVSGEDGDPLERSWRDMGSHGCGNRQVERQQLAGFELFDERATEAEWFGTGVSDAVVVLINRVLGGAADAPGLMKPAENESDVHASPHLNWEPVGLT